MDSCFQMLIHTRRYKLNDAGMRQLRSQASLIQASHLHSQYCMKAREQPKKMGRTGLVRYVSGCDVDIGNWRTLTLSTFVKWNV